MASRHHLRGFTLTELAVVLAIVGLLLGAMMITFSTQADRRNYSETQRRLNEATELILAFAIVNGRLPCPANTSSGDESPPGGGACTNAYNGLLPGRAIGFQPVDNDGFALDAWNNRIRYAVSIATPVNSDSPRICRPDVNPTPPPAYLAPLTPHFTQRNNLKHNGIDCSPSDLVVRTECQTGPPDCPSPKSVTNQNTVVAIVLSTGKDGALGARGANENENLNGDAVFVYRTPDPDDPSAAPGGAYDDLTAWIPVGLLYGRLTAAGVLP